MYVCIWLCWVFVSVRGLSLVVASGGHSSSRCAGLSLSRPLVAEHRLQMRRLSNCGLRAELLRGMWDLPRPGLESAPPALAGRFSTTAPPGKPPGPSFLWICHCQHMASNLAPVLGSIPLIVEGERACYLSWGSVFIGQACVGQISLLAT